MKPQQWIIKYSCTPISITHVVVLVFIIISFTSCIVSKQPAYFQTLKKDETLKGFVKDTFQSKIVVGDKLAITASSLSSVEDALFNGAAAATSSSAGTSNGYTVEQDGNITLRRLGKIMAAGFTRKELALQIQNGLLDYMKQPLVNVNYLNHKVTILGEVKTPQVLLLQEERISLLDALVQSGDVTNNADRSKITIIREEGNEKKIKTINLEDNSIFTSDWYYVKPNDIIMVAADNDRFTKEEGRRNLQTTIGLVASGLSLLIIIADRVIK